MKGVENISFRQLLQHRSGFDDDFKADRTVLGFLRAGFTQSQYNVREYSNINFVMTGYLLPLYEEPGLAGSFDLSVIQNHLAPDAADAYVRDVLGKRMQQMFATRIFSKMTPPIKPSCDATNELKNTVAYGYESKGSTKGVVSSQMEKKGHCSGEGGYYMSARDFANYVAHFSASDLIVSKAGRDAMFTEGMSPDDRLVWTAAAGDNWMGTNFKMPVVVWSNGIPANGKTVLVRLPQNHYLVLFTNSDELSVGQLYGAGVAAFKAGMQHNFN
jgi:CubicO group peptidase (beta-lactamase class C family)